MSSYQCPSCGPEWNGEYTMSHRCASCGSVILAVEPWREDEEEERLSES